MTPEQFAAYLQRQEIARVRCRECDFWIRIRRDDTMHKCTNQVGQFAGLHTLGSMSCDGGRRTIQRSVIRQA